MHNVTTRSPPRPSAESAATASAWTQPHDYCQLTASYTAAYLVRSYCLETVLYHAKKMFKISHCKISATSSAILNLTESGFCPFRDLRGTTLHQRTKFKQNRAIRDWVIMMIQQLFPIRFSRRGNRSPIFSHIWGLITTDDISGEISFLQWFEGEQCAFIVRINIILKISAPSVAILYLTKSGCWPFRDIRGTTLHQRTKFKQNRAMRD